jgi:AraC-like DNA-binding protein
MVAFFSPDDMVSELAAPARFNSYADFLKTAYHSSVLEIRVGQGPVPISLVKIMQPSGRYPDAPTPDLVLATLISPSVNGRLASSSTVRDGDFGLAPAGIFADYSFDARQNFLVVSFPFAPVAASMPELGRFASGDFGRLHSGTFRDDLLSVLVRRMWQEAGPEGSGAGRLFFDGALRTLLGTLVRLAEADTAPVTQRGGLAPHALRRVVDCLESNLANDPGIAALAPLAGLSAWHFSRAFKQSTGLAPHQWLLRRRVQRAQEAMLADERPLGEIALEVGFGSQQHFTTAFKRVTGATPAAWRRERRSL